MNLKKNKSYIVPFDIWSAMDLRGLVSTDDYIWMPYPPDVTAKELAAFSDRWAGAHSILENCSRPREVDPIGSEFDLIHEIVNEYYSYNLIDRSIKSIKFLFSDIPKVFTVFILPISFAFAICPKVSLILRLFKISSLLFTD